MIQIEVQALDYLSALGQEKVISYEAVSKTVSTIVTELLAFQLLSPAVTVGTIDSAIGNLTRSVQADGDSILSVLLMLRDTTGGYIEVDNDRQLNWRTSIGEDKGQQIRYGKNLAGIERHIDYSQLYNRIYAYGEGEGDARIKLSDVIGHTEDYIEDTTSQTEWDGVYISPPFVDRSITHPDTLMAWAEQLLAEHKNPPISYSVNTIDLGQDYDFEALQLGSVVTVIDEDLGIDVQAAVVRIGHPDLSDPYRMIVELSTRTKGLSDALTHVYDTQQLEQHIATKIGAGQVVVLGGFTVLDWVSEGTTDIKGDHIRTGTIESNNWGTGAGSQFKLDDGTFKLGGSSSPKLSWNGTTLVVTGTIYATAGEFSGTIKTATLDVGQTLTVKGTIKTDNGLIELDDAYGITVGSTSSAGAMRWRTGATTYGVITMITGFNAWFFWANSDRGIVLDASSGESWIELYSRRVVYVTSSTRDVVLSAAASGRKVRFNTPQVDMASVQFMDLPRRSSFPAAANGRMFYHTGHNYVYVYDGHASKWSYLHWTGV